MNKAYLLIGGNIGDRVTILSKAKIEIEKSCGSIRKQSSIYETEAWGKHDQNAFLNQVLEIKTLLTAGELMKTILSVEERLGRIREEKYGPRTIDIDIIFFNQDIIEEEGLHIPHPRMQNRRFVLEPLNEIAATYVHPLSGKTVTEILSECKDPLAVNKFS